MQPQPRTTGAALPGPAASGPSGQSSMGAANVGNNNSNNDNSNISGDASKEVAAAAAAAAATASIPEKMKAAVSVGFGSVDDKVRVVGDWPVPALPEHGKKGRGKGEGGLLLVRVLACALAPGDARLLRGDCDYAQLPPAGHPYVVGSDASGIVVDAHGSAKFKRGDYVVSRFDGVHPVGACAEYLLADERRTEICPPAISPEVAASLPASAAVAKRIAREFVRRGDRVLVVGGSGGVGTSLIQYARRAVRGGGGENDGGGGGPGTGPPSGAARGLVVAVSTQAELCLSLGADRVVDYRARNWWEDPELLREPLDVVVDLVNGPDNWPRGGRAGPGTAMKRGSAYVAVLTGVQTEVAVHSAWDLLRTAGWVVGRTAWTRLNPHRLPRWTVPDALRLDEGDLAGLFEDVVAGRLKPVLDPSSPFDFSDEGVRAAMRLQQSARAHGKVVVRVA